MPQKYFELFPRESIQLPPYLENDLADTASENILGWEPGLGLARSDKPTKWIRAQGVEKWQEAVRGYLASVAFADAMIGNVLDALDRIGRADNTIIVLWSDHGWHLGEKDKWGKFSLWEESTRVPFIVVAPGVSKAGSSSSEAVSLQSLYASLSELAGLPVPNHVDGRSLAPLLKDPDMEWAELVGADEFNPGNTDAGEEDD